MKQTFYAFGIAMLIITSQATAQKNETALLTKASILNNAGPEKTASAMADISVVAVESFKADFRDAREVEWKVISKGYRAYFEQNEVFTAVDYDRKGRLYSVIRYGKSLLTKDMEKMLEKRFVDPQVKEVSEVKIADFATKVYVIVMEDNVSIKTVQILEDEVKVIQEIRK
jgi:hypothetical protein